MDYSSLYREGIINIQRLAGSTWTDYNAHDPGITILEQVCFALTDLNYRAEFPVEDLMAEAGAGVLTDHFYPRSMLTSGPVSLPDWRMLLLDIPGVRNVWIKPVDTTEDDFQPRVFFDDVEGLLSLYPVTGTRYTEPLSLQGLYQVDYILDEDYKDAENNVLTGIFRRFQLHRNLGEDLYKINRLKEYPLTIEAKIEITEHPDPESLLAEIFAQIHSYLSPSIRFYTLQEMTAKGYQIDEIMSGPRLEHGFLEKRELEEFGLRQSVRISDLIQLIMAVKGVLAVNSLKLTADNKTLAGTDALDPWEFSVPPNYVASLNIPGENSKPEIGLRHHGLERNVDWKKGLAKFQSLIQEKKGIKKKRNIAELDQPPPAGRNRQVSLHQSILHQFPDIYGVGEKGLPADSSLRRQAQVKQLRGYLSFFDQLLANAFSQLGGARALFGLDEKQTAGQQTYFSQSLIGESPGFEELVDADDYTKNLPYAKKPAAETGEPEAKAKWEANELRQKRLTQHLLARFAERFNDFSQQEFEEQNADQREFLQNYANMSYQRYRGFDYTSESWELGNVSGLERRLCYLLGFPEAKRRSLTKLPADDAGAFHLLEHILLRPVAGDIFQNSPMLLLPFNGDNQRPPQKDPYSLQLSFVFPAWLGRFKDDSYWQFLISTIREQTPAHLKIYIHRLNKKNMASFEEAFKDWLTQLRLFTYDPIS
ncbi:MAG: hypothetical protein WA584_14850 [Pyrinomonadaceae bacterium]